MKHSLLIVLLASLGFASTSFATDLTSIQSFAAGLPGLMGAPAEGGDDDIARPIRMADAKYTVTKVTIERDEDGVFEGSGEIVCNESLSIPVYDLRDGKDAAVSGDSINCHSSLGDQPVTIQTYTQVSYNVDLTDGAELKTYSGAAFYSDSGKDNKFRLMTNTHGTRDLNSSHSRFNLMPDVSGLMSDVGSNEKIEFFTVAIDITDEN